LSELKMRQKRLQASWAAAVLDACDGGTPPLWHEKIFDYNKYFARLADHDA